MTTPFWCLFATVLIPYVLAGLGAAQRKAQLGAIDNKNWRVSQLPKLEGVGARVYSAQANAWEAVALFTAAVVVAHLAGASPRLSAIASLVFVAARILHAVLYLADLDKLRTLTFLVAWGCCIWLFLLAARGAA